MHPARDWIWTAPNATNTCVHQTQSHTQRYRLHGLRLGQSRRLKSDPGVDRHRRFRRSRRDLGDSERGQSSDHASFADGTEGPSWVASVVNAIGNSQFWSSTADHHCLGTIGEVGTTTSRLPSIPPMAITIWLPRTPCRGAPLRLKAGYISHVQHDFGSIPEFIAEEHQPDPSRSGICRHAFR